MSRSRKMLNILKADTEDPDLSSSFSNVAAVHMEKHINNIKLPTFQLYYFIIHTLLSSKLKKYYLYCFFVSISACSRSMFL